MPRVYGESIPLPRGWRFVALPEVSVAEQIEILERIERKAKDPVVLRDIRDTIAKYRGDGPNNGSSN